MRGIAPCLSEEGKERSRAVRDPPCDCVHDVHKPEEAAKGTVAYAGGDGQLSPHGRV